MNYQKEKYVRCCGCGQVLNPKVKIDWKAHPVFGQEILCLECGPITGKCGGCGTPIGKFGCFTCCGHANCEICA